MAGFKILDIIGGYIPQVRIERITVESGGGKTIHEDNPHIVEEAPRIVIPGEAATSWVAPRDFSYKTNIIRAIFQEMVDVEISYIEDNPHIRDIQAPRAGGTANFANLVVITKLIKEYLREAGLGSELVGFAKLEDPGAYQAINASTSVYAVEVGEGAALEGAHIDTPQYFQFMAELNRWFENNLGTSPEMIRGMQRVPIDLSLGIKGWTENMGPRGLITPVSGFYGRQGDYAPIYDDIFIPFIWALNRRAFGNFENEFGLMSRAVTAQSLISAEEQTERDNPQLSVSLLLNVKSTIGGGGFFRSWMENQDIFSALEFVVIESKDIASIEHFARMGRIVAGAGHTAGLYAINVDFANKNSFISAPGIAAMTRNQAPFTLNGPYSIKDLMQTNMSDLQREPSLDTEGSQIYEFNFPLHFEYNTPRIPADLGFFVVPYVNVPALVESIVSTSEFELNASDFEDSIKYFIGNTTADLVLRNNDIMSTARAFVDQNTGEPWPGPVHYHPAFNPTADGYVGWMGGMNHDPNSTQTKLRIETVANNKVQDFRRVERLEKFTHDLTLTNLSGFKPQIILQNNTVRTNENNSYFTDIELTPTLDNEINLFFGFDYAGVVRRETIFGKLWDKLSDPEKSELFSYVQLKFLQIVRRQIKDIPVLNKLGGLSEDLLKINEAQYEEPDFLVIDYNGQQPSNQTPGASIEDVTPFINNLRNGQRTRFSDVGRRFGRVRFFTAKDRSASALVGGQYQYGVKISILDNTLEFFKRRRQVLQTQLMNLKRYYELAMESRNYNPALNRLTRHFVQGFQNGQIRYVSLGKNPIAPNPHVLPEIPIVEQRESVLFGRRIQSTEVRYENPAAPPTRYWITTIPPEVSNVATIVSDPTAVFIKTLKLLHEKSNFNENQISEIILNFLDPEVASRDSIYRVIQLCENLLAKIDEIIGGPTAPKAAAGPTTPPESPRKRSRLISFEKFSTDIFNATIPSRNGYYYMQPVAVDNVGDLFSGGLRKLKFDTFKEQMHIEWAKNFALVRDTADLGRVQNIDLTVQSLGSTKWSYFSPRYICFSKKRETRPRNLRTGGALNLPRSHTHFRNREDVNIFEHRYNITSGPRWINSFISYNLLINRIRLLNSDKNLNAVPVLGEAEMAELNRETEEIFNTLTPTQRQIKITMLNIMGLRSCTVMGPDQFNDLLGRPPNAPAPAADDLLLNDRNRSALQALGDQSPIVSGEALRGAGQLRDEYIESFARIDSTDPTGVLRNILEEEKAFLHPRMFRRLASEADAVNNESFNSFFQNDSVAVPPTRYWDSLPVQLKMLNPQQNLPPVVIAERTLKSWTLHRARGAGIFDIHFNKIMRIETFLGFEENGDGEMLMDKPIWRILNEVPDLQINSLYRLRPYSNGNIHIGHPLYLEMPVFDQFFFVEGESFNDEAINGTTESATQVGIPGTGGIIAPGPASPAASYGTSFNAEAAAGIVAPPLLRRVPPSLVSSLALTPARGDMERGVPRVRAGATGPQPAAVTPTTNVPPVSPGTPGPSRPGGSGGSRGGGY